MGATTVLDTAADTPPAMKSLAKATGSASPGMAVWLELQEWYGQRGPGGELLCWLLTLADLCSRL